jgi:hypothetical protein
MRGVDDQRPGGELAQPGERRLERPPSDRYTPAVPEPSPNGAGSQGHAIAYAVLAAIGGAVAITVGGGLLAMTAGLLVIAAALGWAVAAALSTSRDGGTRTRRMALAAGMAAIGVALGQLGLWVVARQEGGTLGLVDYLGEVFGILVLLQLGIAVAVAWWRAR